MAHIVVTASADADFAAIMNELYTAAGRTTLVKYRTLFQKLYQRLSAFPVSGAPREQWGHGVRLGIISPYLVIYKYRENDDTIIVLRILHGKRKITKHMLQ